MGAKSSVYNTIQTYLGKWGEKRISAIPLSKFWEIVGEKRDKWCHKSGREKTEFGNGICQNMCPKKPSWPTWNWRLT